MQPERVDREYMHREVDTVNQTRRSVVVAVTAQHCHPSFDHELQCSGVESGPGTRCIPRAEYSPAMAMADAHEHQVAVANGDVLGRLGPPEVVRGYVFAWFEPGNSSTWHALKPGMP